jgi:hypothetical protein
MEGIVKICRIRASAMNKHDQRILTPKIWLSSLENAAGFQTSLLLLEVRTDV